MGAITRDEMLPILIYIILKAKVPDLASQVDLITVCSSEYIKQGEDGSLISQTFQNLQVSL